MSRYLSFLFVFLINVPSVIQASPGTPTYNFSSKAIENIPNIVQKANSPNLNDRIEILKKIVYKPSRMDVGYYYRFYYDLSDDDYISAAKCVLDFSSQIQVNPDIFEIFGRITYVTIELKAKQLLPQIINFLDNEHQAIQLYTLKILGELDAKQYTKEIIKTAYSTDLMVSRDAETILANFNSKEAVPLFISCFNDENQAKRMIAIEALGNIGDPNAILPLIQLLKTDVYQQAIIALVNMDAKEAVPYIKETMQYAKNSRDPHLGEVLILTSLAYFGDEQAISDIMSKMIDNRSLYYESYLERLVVINARPIIPEFIKALEEEQAIGGQAKRGESVIRSIMKCLAKLNATEAIPALRLYLKLQPAPSDVDDFLESGAIEALGILRAKEAIPELLQILESENKSIHYGSIRSETAMALARIGEPATIGRLVSAMRKYKIKDSEIFEELNHISDPDTYNKLANTEIARIESSPGSKFLIQISEKSGVPFSISEQIQNIDEFKMTNVVWSSYTGLKALNLAIYIFNTSGKSGALYFINEGTVYVITHEEAYDLWENWSAEYMKNHPDNSESFR